LCLLFLLSVPHVSHVTGTGLHIFLLINGVSPSATFARIFIQKRQWTQSVNKLVESSPDIQKLAVCTSTIQYSCSGLLPIPVAGLVAGAPNGPLQCRLRVPYAADCRASDEVGVITSHCH
jgi:hypothetical protein